MEPENGRPVHDESPSYESAILPAPAGSSLERADGAAPEPRSRDLRWVFIGSHGLRAGWTVAIFLAIMFALTGGLDYLFAQAGLVNFKHQFAPKSAFFSELAGLLALLGAAWLTARIEHRHILDYNLRGPRRVSHFFAGLVTGFAALSALVGTMAWGGWMHFGPVALSGKAILLYAAIWGGTFLMVGCVEEGIVRCFLLATLTRGVNFWWAGGLVALMCGDLLWRAKGNGVWGVYVMALAGVLPCLWLQLKEAPGTGFWNAAWLTSTLFGFGHVSNNGENWIGILGAASIGFVFCVSIRLTGSAWWAIGCHASWDWAETYFYGTADSGLVAKGHLLTTTPAGSAFWSGGTAGPEGSVLVLGIILLLLIALLALYGRRPASSVASAPTEQAAG